MYKLTLILKYLLKRRIAWVSLAAVMLCTTMVLVVISVMGGWLNMFKHSFHGLTGDVIVKSESLEGFAYYDEMIQRIEKQSDIAAAVPTIETFALFNVGSIPTAAVKVMGLPIDKIGSVNNFPASLYRQHTSIQDELKQPGLSPDQRASLEKELAKPPSFTLLDRAAVPLKMLPGDVKLSDTAPGPIAACRKSSRAASGSTAQTGNLVFKGVMRPDEKLLIRGLSEDASFKQAVDALFPQLQQRQGH